MIQDESGAWGEVAGDYDPSAVQFYDIAHEGAQLRSIANFASSGGLEDLAGSRPRSLVVLAEDDVMRAAVMMACAYLEPLAFPVTLVSELPSYVGPLDVVLVASARGAHPLAERAVSMASQRGCTTLLLAPTSSPLVDDAASNVIIVPDLPTVDYVSPARIMATIFSIVRIADGKSNSRCSREELELLADHVDEELQRVAPDRDAVVNPAYGLREFVGDGRIIHSGRDAGNVALARLVAALWNANGIVCSAMDFDALVTASPKLNSNTPDIFYDPFEDDRASVLPLKIVIWGVEEANLPHAIAQQCSEDADESAVGLDCSLRLLVRAMAATAISVTAEGT